jgi:hypothetical protein
MWRKIAIAGGVCAAIVGVGTAALATSGASPTAGSPSPASSAATGTSGTSAAKQHARNVLRRALHAQWVTQDKDTKAFVTHDAIRGMITAVSPTSITVESLDKKSETYAVTSATNVRIRANGKGAKGAISQVHTGEQAIVVGTGTSPLTAQGILGAAK